MKQCFLICKSINILKVYSIVSGLRTNTNATKEQNKRLEKYSFYFRELQLITDSFLILDSYISWSTGFDSRKACVRFSSSIPFRFDWNLLFCSKEYMNSLTLKRHTIVTRFFEYPRDRKKVRRFPRKGTWEWKTIGKCIFQQVFCSKYNALF